MAKYRIVASGAMGHYRGEVVDESDLPGGAARLLSMDPPAIEKVSEDTDLSYNAPHLGITDNSGGHGAARADVPESDMTDGDGNAVTKDGVNIAPGAPPQKTDDTTDTGLYDDATRAKLAAAGFNTPEKIATASDDELRAVPGIGPATLAKIRGGG